MAHTGHLGMVRMKCKMREGYWWPGLNMQVETMVKCCPGCQRNMKSQPPNPVPQISVPKPTIPWQKLGPDIAGPFHMAPQHQQFVVLVVNYHSGYPEVLLTTDIRSMTIIRWLHELFMRYGCPDSIVMDNGPQFVSAEFRQFLELKGVHLLVCSVFSPRENGLVECWNCMLKGDVQAFCSLGKPWEEGMLELLTQHCHMPATPQGPSSAELLFGRHT